MMNKFQVENKKHNLPRNVNQDRDDEYDYEEEDYYQKAPKVRKFREYRAR